MSLNVPNEGGNMASTPSSPAPSSRSDQYIPASPGPYNHGAAAVGPAAVLQLQHGHFLITMTVTTTFPPSAVLPTVYSLLPTSQLQCDHIDIQVDDKTHKMRVQVVGINPVNNPHAVSSLASRMKALQPGATVVVHKELSQLSVDSDSISAVSSLLMSSQSRALLDQHIQYYRLHSHPAFIPSLVIYVSTARVEHVINVMRNFMADPVAGGAVRPPPPSSLEVKGDDLPSNSSAASSAPTVVSSSGALPPTTPEKPTGLPVPPRTIQSSSRSPHFKPKSSITNSSSSLLPSSTGLDANIPGSSNSTPAASPSSTVDSSTAHPVKAAAPTSVAQTQPIRIDNKWWSSKRAELLTLHTRHALTNDSLYVYSLEAVRKNVGMLKSLSAIDRIFYACKANMNEDILRTLYQLGVGFECVSIQELKYVRSLFPDLDKERLLFTPNFAAKLEYEEAYFYTDYVNLDNIYPLEAWPEVFRNKTILLRMDPGEGLGYHAHVQTGGARSKFGVSVEQLQANVGLIKSLAIKVIGLHVHKGSGIHDATAWSRTANFLAQFLKDFPEVRILDLGGGLGVQYKDTDNELNFEQLNKEIQAFRSSTPGADKLQLWLEPGRFIVATCGVILTPVTQLKTKPGRNFVGLATGMNSLIRPALYESYHEIINLSKLGSSDSSTRKEGNGSEWLNNQDDRSYKLVDVVGPICETGDVLGHARSLPINTCEGDIILIDTAGAYGRVMSSSYNMREPAKEVAIE